MLIHRSVNGLVNGHFSLHLNSQKVVSSDLWKTEPKKSGSAEPWKLQILTSKSSPKAQGAALRTRKGPVPWPIIGLCPNPSSPEGRKRAHLPLFCQTGSSVSLMSIDFRGISSQPAAPPAPVFHGSIDNSSDPIQQFRFSACSGWFVGQGR